MDKDNVTSREKYWSELNDSEKVERMRQIIKQKKYMEEKVHQLESMVLSLRNELREHNHCGDKVVIPMTPFLQGGYSTGLGGATIGTALTKHKENPNEVYF